ncbi:MAG: aminotransferase class V-fold PLP-dependent enzyme [Candidatus Symbiothrix sp.]|jgi:aspartate aminotransferase-like enzyme|nr:aminotransferase class V-fold PLP-dependent enzyme [Candidatus Symbiothrix sp.]
MKNSEAKLFTPGPIQMDPETIAIGGMQSQYFRTSAFSQIMLDCAARLKHLLDAPHDAEMIFLTASGTAAMEASVMNLFTPQDKLLIISGGTFGKRFKQISEIYHIPSEVISLEWDESFHPEMLTPYENAGITGMLVNLCETSTGQLYPMDAISAFCKRNHICLVVDAISAFLCDSFSMKESGASAVIISSQKGLALHAGMSFVAITKEAFETRCAKNKPQTLYFNFVDYQQEMLRGQTPYTPGVAIINQLHDKLQRLEKAGTTASIACMTDLANYFRQQLLANTDFTYPDYPLSNCLTPVYCPKHNAKAIFDTLRDEHNIYITPCAGDIASFLFRVAHMSQQLTRQDIDELVTLLKQINEK